MARSVTSRRKANPPGALLIELRNVTKIYGQGEAEVRALDGINLRIDEGEFAAVMGPSGSGKSTAMNIIGCLDLPTTGNYLFNGVEVGGLDRKQRALLRRNYLGFVFQGFNLLARTSAVENVELPLIYRGMKLAGRVLLAPLEANAGKRVHGKGAAFGELHAAIDQWQLDILHRGCAGEEIEALKHEAEIIAPEQGALLAVEAAHLDAVEQI